MLRIALPAWNARFVELANRYAIPSLLNALRGRPAQFHIYTDRPHAFVGDFVFHSAANAGTRDVHKFQAEFHRQVLREADDGDVVMTMNADVVVSRECFDEAERLLTGNIKCIAVLGLRCLVQAHHGKWGIEPPLDATARELLDWSWANLHPLFKECIWGTGRTHHPTLLLFEGPGGVVANCFHLHPIFVRKDRKPAFSGTVDCDCLAQYRPDEIHIVQSREMAFAELSPTVNMPRRVGQLGVGRVAQFARERLSKAHVSSFQKTIRITGDGPVDNSAVAEIVMGISRG